MPRLLKKAELFSDVREVGYLKEADGTHGNSTLASPATKGQKTLTVVSGTNYTTGDYVIINSGEMMEVGRIASVLTNTITLRSNLMRDHDAGASVLEAVRVRVGDITDDGVDLLLAEGDFNAVTAATLRQTAGYLIGHIAQGLNFSVEHTNAENIAAALGIPESAISGTGTEADPRVLDILAESMGTAPEFPWYFFGARKDGTLIEVYALGVEVDPTAVGSIKYARGAPAPIPFGLRPTAGIRWLEYK